MLRLVFIVECGITRFLCAMRVFKVRASSSPPTPPLCQIFCFFRGLHCWASPRRKKTRKTRRPTRSINHSLTQLIWCPGNRSFRFEKRTTKLFSCFNLLYCKRNKMKEDLKQQNRRTRPSDTLFLTTFNIGDKSHWYPLMECHLA